MKVNSISKTLLSITCSITLTMLTGCSSDNNRITASSITNTSSTTSISVGFSSAISRSTINSSTMNNSTTNSSANNASAPQASSQSTLGANKHQFKRYAVANLQMQYVQFEQLNQQLYTQALAFCAQTVSPKDSTLFKDAWVASNYSWQYLQAITFGPVAQSSRRYDIAYYPINKNTFEAKIQTLVEDNEQPLTTTYIAEQAASRQGLVALEYLLFRDHAISYFTEDDIGLRYCEYAQGISQRLIDLSAAVVAEWLVGGIYYTTVMSDVSTDSFNEAIFGAINERLAIITGDKITKVQAGNTTELESAYAHLSLGNIKQNIAFVRDMYGQLPNNENTEQGILAWLSENNHKDVAAEMHNRLGHLELILNELGDSLVDELAANDADETIGALLEAIHDVHEYHARTAAQALNIFIGFSGADGD